ncbi:Serologically defined colon cancer antigen 8 [Nymphon striatum]|nr:Serologically defined colon cancer antigen 8 [Nymphon striatum]
MYLTCTIMDDSSSDIEEYNRSYSESIEQLKNLMNEVNLSANEQENEKFAEIAYQNQELQMKDESILNVATHQNKYIYQLEQEISFLREQLGVIKHNIQDVITENENLREDAKRSYVHVLKTEATAINDEVSHDSTYQFSSNEMWEKWLKELERVKSLYQATSMRLESQVDYFRSELIKKQEEIEELKSKIRSNQSDSFIDEHSRKVPSLCINCSSQEGALFTNPSSNSSNVQNLIKDKEELSQLLAKIRLNLKESEAREEDSHNQVKNSVLLVEQAHFEKTKLEAENIYLKQNFNKEEHRMKDIITEYKDNLKKERELITEKWSQRLNILEGNFAKQNDENIEIKVSLEKANNDKQSIQKVLNSTKYQVNDLQEKIAAMQYSMKLEISQLQAERDSLMENIRQHTNEKDQLRNIHKMEIESMQMKIDVAEKKLVATERNLLNNNEQCLALSQTITALEKQANFAMLSKQNVERSYTDDVKSLSKEAALKEKQLTSCLNELETEYDEKISSMDEIILSQNSIITQLQEECHILTNKLEDVTKQAWLEKCEGLEVKTKLTTSLQVTMERLSSLKENQRDFAQIEVRLKQRLMDSENAVKQNSNQVYDLIQKQLVMSNERQRLNEEIDFLHQELINLSASYQRRNS